LLIAGSSVITRDQVIISNADVSEQGAGTNPSLRPSIRERLCISLPSLVTLSADSVAADTWNKHRRNCILKLENLFWSDFSGHGK